MNRNEVLGKAVEECLKEMYSFVQPPVEWEDFIQQNKEWKEGNPKPYEFYYLPKEVFNEILESYIYSYNIRSQFSDCLELLEDYFNNPSKDKYDEKMGRTIEHFTPLIKIIGEENYKKVLDYIKEAKKFYKDNHELNSFNMSICLGASPSSNQEEVIKNWKKYYNKNITIDNSYWDENYDC